MTTYRDTDIESLIEDLRTAVYSDNPDEAIGILLAKKSRKQLDKLNELCETFTYIYEKAQAKGLLK